MASSRAPPRNMLLHPHPKSARHQTCHRSVTMRRRVSQTRRATAATPSDLPRPGLKAGHWRMPERLCCRAGSRPLRGRRLSLPVMTWAIVLKAELAEPNRRNSAAYTLKGGRASANRPRHPQAKVDMGMCSDRIRSVAAAMKKPVAPRPSPMGQPSTSSRAYRMPGYCKYRPRQLHPTLSKYEL